jgi:hypothetical protein
MEQARGIEPQFFAWQAKVYKGINSHIWPFIVTACFVDPYFDPYNDPCKILRISWLIIIINFYLPI